jgi:ABC-type transport system involved in multi-copper enzyme maturation permease subunit
MAATNSTYKFAAIAYNEVLLNSKRVAPYAVMIVCSAAAFLGWVRGPAVALGWATNSDFYISRGLKGFSFLFGPPLFNAVIMGNPVIRDFRSGIDPLIFSKPVNRAQYLFGKFFGNFFVLVCCMAAFPLTQMLLQAFSRSGMVVQEAKVLPYFKHFFFFVVITHLTLAAIYFTAGTLTRNSKIVYGLAVSFYPIYVSLMLLLVSPLTIRWKIFFDAFLLSSGPSNNGFGNSAAFLNSYVMSYTPDMIVNRVLLILGAVLCLTITYVKFTPHERAQSNKHFSTLKLSLQAKFERVRVFAAIAFNEVLLNSKRVAPYVVAALCAGNALLWWGWGPATGRGMAVNSDLFIAGVLPPYSFLFLPLYTALFMADPAIRDFRAGIDPLIFSKPVTRAEYLLGKFFGNFFVLACCQAAFVLTLFVLQWVPKQGVTTLQETKFLAYPRHFLVFVAISHMFLAAVYFTVGTLTRNAKTVYGLGIAFYPIYATYQTILLNSLPWRWKLALDPLVMNRGGSGEGFGPRMIRRNAPELLNQLVVVYDNDLIVNRVIMILLTALCLTILYWLFTSTERSGKAEHFSVLNLSTAAEAVYYPESAPIALLDRSVTRDNGEGIIAPTALPKVVRANDGIRTTLQKLIAALGVEFRLLFAERSLVVVMPLAIVLSVLEVAFFNIPPDVSHSAAYATNTAKLLLLFLIGITVFYTGEALHRDREVRIEPVVWSTPVKNSVLLLSKCLATIGLTFSLVTAVGLIAILIQLMRGRTPVDLSAYLMVYGVVLVPGIVFITAFVVLLNVLLRNKYLAYVAAIGTGAGLFYSYSVGYNHWLYNPLLYQLWKYQDLTSARILTSRLYCLIFAAACLALAHVLFERRST